MVVVGVVVLVAVVFAVLWFTVLSSGSDDAGAAYQQKVTGVMAPVMTANKQLSSALDALRGTKPTLAQRRVKAAQEATTAARGGLEALTVPKGSEQLATNARGTLTREAAYLDAVSASLSNPASESVSQTQTLASNLTSALDVVAPAGQDWAQSVSGSDTLTSWAPKTVSTLKARKRAAARRAAASRSSQTSSSAGSAGSSTVRSGGTDCGGGVHAGPNTSCAFAQNVKDAYGEAPGASATVRVYSPTTGQTYTMSCAPAGSGVTCSGANDASVTF